MAVEINANVRGKTTVWVDEEFASDGELGVNIVSTGVDVDFYLWLSPYAAQALVNAITAALQGRKTGEDSQT